MKKYVVAEYDVANQISHDIEYFQKNKTEYQQIYCSEVREIEDISDQEIEEFFWGDYDKSIYWEMFEIDLEEEFTKQIGKEVYVEGKNMGWRNRSGEKTFTLNETIDMFREIAPKCDLTYLMTKDDNGEYEVRIAHHDSPMGETYNIKIK
tara:strand:- start:586 stop:1035 length:450 start_codon:yes stop_codon:yes gene_type:complete